MSLPIAPLRPFAICMIHLDTTQGSLWEEAIGSNVTGLTVVRYIPLSLKEKCKQLNDVFEAGFLAGIERAGARKEGGGA